MNVIVFHGTKGSPDINWFPWIKEKVQETGLKIDIPVLPTPEGHNLKNWLVVANTLDINEDTILIGHSCGATFLLHLLEKKRIKEAIFVSCFTEEINIPEYDKLNASFIKDSDWDWNTIKRNSGKITIYHGSDDPYVPIDQAKDLHEQIGGGLEVIEGGGHLNSENGYTKFPELWNHLKHKLNRETHA